MSVTAKSLVLNAKSFRPAAEPVEVYTTCRPCWVVSLTHWLTAFALHDEPVPSMRACAGAAVAALPVVATRISIRAAVMPNRTADGFTVSLAGRRIDFIGCPPWYGRATA